MAKSLNLELINVILQGITKFADKNYSEVQHLPEEEIKIRSINLDKITIKLTED